jgi:hypothetical protein
MAENASMNKTLAAALALGAGLLSGLLTRYIAPPAASAQNQAPITKEIRAAEFHAARDETELNNARCK